jgi:CBS domain-containing protein
VREGGIQIHRNGGQTLVDECDTGDVFGVRALLAQDAYLATAQASEDTLLYCIPVAAGQQELMVVPEVAWYFASGFASGKAVATQRYAALQTNEPELYSAIRQLSGVKSLVYCGATTAIAQAAAKMVAAKVSALLVCDAAEHPIGIVTDRDLRTQVATGLVSIQAPISDIMSHPVVCMRDGQTHADYLIAMLQNRIHHLCITTDGTPQSRAIGMVTEHDLLLEQGDHPAVLLREIQQHQLPKDLQNLRAKAGRMFHKSLQAKAPIDFVMRMATAINDQLVRKAIDLAIADLGPPPVPFAWLALGSLGRGEQILQTDQDHALVFENGPHHTYFLALANQVVELLELFGFEKDPAGIMANNPLWCLTIDEWQQNFKRWMHTPDPKSVLHTTIFFDFRCVSGQQTLSDALRQYIQALLPETALFLGYLAKDALQTPAPLSFFKNWVLEREGSHKDAFDLKLRVGLPLADCARVLSLHLLNTPVGTAARYRAMATAESQNAALFEAAAGAAAYVVALRARFGFANNDTGRFIQPQALSKLERQTLRNIFDTIADLQELVGVRFQTQQLR